MIPPLRLGVTCGDPAGVGPEVMEAALAQFAQEFPEQQVVIRRLGFFGATSPGQPTAASARLAWDALEEAASLACAGELDGIVTGPVCKYRLREIGFLCAGQTEFLARQAGVEEFLMVLTGGKITVGLVTTHVPLRAVPDLLTPSSIERAGRLLLSFLGELGVARPRIAVAGLNPHAGENGEFGDEEMNCIAPALAALNRLYPGVFSGPWPPDTVFLQALEGSSDATLCHYHDQGLIALKLHAFHEGVNATVGLPFVRTSPDHGTAFALAGQGKASPSSALAALRLAVRWAQGRRRLLSSPLS